MERRITLSEFLYGKQSNSEENENIGESRYVSEWQDESNQDCIYPHGCDIERPYNNELNSEWNQEQIHQLEQDRDYPNWNDNNYGNQFKHGGHGGYPFGPDHHEHSNNYPHNPDNHHGLQHDPGYPHGSGSGGQNIPQIAPPPGYIPQMPSWQNGSNGIGNCLNDYTHIWQRNGMSYWFFPTQIERNVVNGFIWTRRGWTYHVINRNAIRSYQCFAS